MRRSSERSWRSGQRRNWRDRSQELARRVAEECWHEPRRGGDLKALVTGAGGFLGGAVARALKQRGDQVCGFSRGDHPTLAEQDIEQVRGSVADVHAIVEAVRGMDVVFHAAAKVAAGGARKDFWDTNVRGTENVIAACLECGVSVLVHTSTPSVTFGKTDLEGVDESVGYSEHFEAFYGESKAAGEQRVLAASSDNLKTVALRPHLVWGPGDTSILPSLVHRARTGQLRRIVSPPKRSGHTYIDDAVRAHLLAADLLITGGEAASRVTGRPYFITAGEPVEIWTFINALLATAGVPPVEKSVSLPAAMAAGWVFEKLHAITGASGDPRMTRWIVRELTTSHWFDISAARRDLGYEPTVMMEEGMRRLAEWIEQEGGVQDA